MQGEGRDGPRAARVPPAIRGAGQGAITQRPPPPSNHIGKHPGIIVQITAEAILPAQAQSSDLRAFLFVSTQIRMIQNKKIGFESRARLA